MSATMQDHSLSTTVSSDQNGSGTLPDTGAGKRWSIIIAGGIAATLLLIRSLM